MPIIHKQEKLQKIKNIKAETFYWYPFSVHHKVLEALENLQLGQSMIFLNKHIERPLLCYNLNYVTFEAQSHDLSIYL